LWKKKFVYLYFDPEKQTKDREKAIELKNQNIPDALYKYGPFDKESHTLDLLKNDKMWLSNPNKFNDPFDCAISSIPKLVINEYFREGIDGIINNISLELAPEEIDHIKSSTEPTKELLRIINTKNVSNRKTQKMVELMREADENAEAILKDSKEEYSKFYSKLIKESKDKTFITCFSEKNDSILMWSHYADRHKGLCIEYDFSSLENHDLLKQFLFPVIYENTIFDATKFFIHSKILHNISYRAAITKSHEWSYEKEWRYVNTINKKSNEHYINLPKPKSVYLGAKANEENTKDVIKIAKERNFEVYKMEMRDSKFYLDAICIK